MTEQAPVTNFLNNCNHELSNLINTFLQNLDVTVIGNSVIDNKKILSANPLAQHINDLEMTLDDFLFTELEDILGDTPPPERLSKAQFIHNLQAETDKYYIDYEAPAYYGPTDDVVELVEYFLNSLDAFVYGSVMFHNSYFSEHAGIIRDNIITSFDNTYEDYI